MNPHFGTKLRLQVFAVAMIALVSLAALTGCATGAYPAMLPITPAVPPEVMPALFEALNPTTHMLYVSNSTANAVYVFDMASNKKVTTIPIGVKEELPVKPSEMAVNPVTNTVYVLNGNGSISVIDGATNVVSTTISPIVGPAMRIAVNAVTNKIYVSTGVLTRRPDDGGANNNFLVLDGETNKVSGGLALSPSCVGLAVDAQTNTVYATTYTSVAVIDDSLSIRLANGDLVDFPVDVASVRARKDDGNGHLVDDFSGDLVDVAVDQTSHTVYAVRQGFDSGSNQVFVIDSTNYGDPGKISLASAPNRVAVNPQTQAVYVTLSATDLAIIDGSGKVDSRSFSKGPTGVPDNYPLTDITVNPLDGLIYVTQGSDVNVITPGTYAWIGVPVAP